MGNPCGSRPAEKPAERSGRQPAERSGRHRAILKNLPTTFSWNELKDEMRRIGDVIYADVDSRGDGCAGACRLPVLRSCPCCDAALASPPAVHSLARRV